MVFYTMPEYEAWKESLGGNTIGWSIKYYKASVVLSVHGSIQNIHILFCICVYSRLYLCERASAPKQWLARSVACIVCCTVLATS